MPKRALQALAITGITALIVANAPSKRIGPDYLYPKPITPGAAATLSVQDLTSRYNGQTYSQAHRNVPAGESAQVYKEYGITSHNPGEYEVDHFYPLCAGGSNDIKNLWPEPSVNEWNGKDYGFHTKDKLEAWVCEQIKAGKLDPKVAFQRITGDWVAYYNEVLPDFNAAGIKEEGD